MDDKLELTPLYTYLKEECEVDEYAACGEKSISLLRHCLASCYSGCIYLPTWAAIRAVSYFE